MCQQHDEGHAWNIPRMTSARWVNASMLGWDTTPAWLQNECVMGYWVQFDADSPFRLVENIEEINHEQIE